MAHCRWLGSQQDPDTHYAYPTEENICTAPNGPRPLELEIQNRWCLTVDYAACLYFVLPNAVPPAAPPERL